MEMLYSQQNYNIVTVNNENSNRTVHMRRQIWIIAERLYVNTPKTIRAMGMGIFKMKILDFFPYFFIET